MRRYLLRSVIAQWARLDDPRKKQRSIRPEFWKGYRLDLVLRMKELGLW